MPNLAQQYINTHLNFPLVQNLVVPMMGYISKEEMNKAIHQKDKQLKEKDIRHQHEIKEKDQKHTNELNKKNERIESLNDQLEEKDEKIAELQKLLEEEKTGSPLMKTRIKSCLKQ